MQEQTNSSITLSWTAPLDPEQPPYTYLVSWVREGTRAISRQKPQDTRIILKELQAGRLYIITVQAQRNEVSSDNRTLTGATGETQASSGQTQYYWDGGRRGLGRRWRPHLTSLDLELVSLPSRKSLSLAARVFHL